MIFGVFIMCYLEVLLYIGILYKIKTNISYFQDLSLLLYISEKFAGIGAKIMAYCVKICRQTKVVSLVNVMRAFNLKRKIIVHAVP